MSDDETRSTEFSDEEVGEDDEATMAEEELNNDDDDADDELRMLNEENEMSVEELRRKYYGEAAVAEVPAGNGPAASSSAAGEPTTLFGEDVEEEEEDDDYVPKAPEYWKKEVRVGPNYQAEFPLPEVKPSSPKEEVEVLNDSEPLWIPAKLTKKELEDFLVKVYEKLHELEDAEVDTTPQANRKPKYDGVTDDEDALFALYKANYDIQKALSKLPYDPANGPRVTAPKKWRPMSKEDADRFEEAFSEYGKNFFKIHKEKMTDRSVGELINFYYVWKKTERHDMYIAARRALGQLEGPKATDPMEILVDQHLNDSNGTVPTSEPEPAAHKTWLAVPHEPAPEQK
ncbi:unnamed protein product [Bursaphelenchus xylophilus]|uniref:(pine wood nematode) hypothetical protein n=1 Tax=Bursaphelenchus xylophilus TaxID=6326 RepID=A0A1I7SVG8_BURXY|nr:unnamed protein product [Bursaphelenchus xylophilus]CAG9101434.1 unnamed protein product [Bursaphelenchus xylophilus]